MPDGIPYAAHTRDVLDDSQRAEGDFYYELNSQKGYVAWQGGATSKTKAVTRPSGAKALGGSKFSHDWGSDPFARGSYSIRNFTEEVRSRLLHVAPGLFFAGEYLCPEVRFTGYMEGAVRSGLDVAEKVRQSLTQQ